ncbi:MAG TPA: hypothetical protein VFE86_05075 [Ilumatobacteraceae bacterium]|nr:hypothetical protein [Ilumatobacteraceae bacterium]
MKSSVLYHFSEDPNIERFVPHVPKTNPTHRAAVWAIDDEHAPLYWFPRDCPRVTIWPFDDDGLTAFQSRLTTSARRVHAIESGWYQRMCEAQVYRYELDAQAFEPWEQANGQWITGRTVVPVSAEPVGDLVDAHHKAGIELRLVPSLWPLHDIAVEATFDFSLVGMHNAQRRRTPSIGA